MGLEQVFPGVRTNAELLLQLEPLQGVGSAAVKIRARPGHFPQLWQSGCACSFSDERLHAHVCVSE